jgi:hypothetical protein
VAKRALGRQPGRAEEDDGVVDALSLEGPQGLQVLGEDAQRASLVAVEEVLVLIGQP